MLNICNVEPDPRDRWGHTPSEEAERGNHAEVVDLIRTTILERDEQ